ncbi:MAG: hypothetical protein WC879_10425 [Melioribacteraceae bacterium]
MWDYVLTFLVGATVPIFINWLQRRDERKKFDLERKDKYKLVAIEKRLEAHQQAFNHWRKLLLVIHGRDIEQTTRTLKDAQEFWNLNCLYLENKTRKDFAETIFRTSNHPSLIDQRRMAEKGEEKETASRDIKENWDFIHKLGITIQQDVELEPITLKRDYNPEGKELEEE